MDPYVFVPNLLGSVEHNLGTTGTDE